MIGENDEILVYFRGKTAKKQAAPVKPEQPVD
jgi:hypothetical protein